MATQAGSGHSAADDPKTAGSEAAKRAVEAMGGGKPDILFVFASTHYEYPPLLAAIREATEDTHLVGCSTAGQFTEGEIGQKGVAVMAIKSDSIRFHTSLGTGLRTDNANAANTALKDFAELNRVARSEGFSHATCFVCADGLAGGGESTVERVHEATGMLAQVVGGAAADDAKFQRTDVFFDDQHHTDAMTVVMAFSRTPIGLGVRHGLNPGCDSMIVTKSEGTVLKEIDGKPAVDAYATFAKSIGESFDDREGFMITHEVGMLTPDGDYKIRAPLSVNEDGSLAMAAEVPTGTSVTIMKGTNDGLVSASEAAAKNAVANLEGGKPAAVLAFDCICRRIFLGDEYKRQVEVFGKIVGEQIPIVGWETYGEIAMTPNQPTGWHNSTSVVAVLPD